MIPSFARFIKPMLLMPILAWVGCDGYAPKPPSAYRPTVVDPELPDAPKVEEFSVWRPFFKSETGNQTTKEVTGTAFVVDREEASTPVIVTAFHLAAEASGLGTDVGASEVIKATNSIFVSDAFGATDSITRIGEPLSTNNAEADNQLWKSTDILVLEKGKKLRAKPFEIEPTSVSVGDRIWMTTAVYAGASASRKCHPAKVTEVDENGALVYQFENERLSMEATSGAPLLSDAGKVAGIHFGGELIDGTLVGSGRASDVLLKVLVDLSSSH